MEEDDKGCPMIRMGVSGWVFLLVPAYTRVVADQRPLNGWVCVLSKTKVQVISWIICLNRQSSSGTWQNTLAITSHLAAGGLVSVDNPISQTCWPTVDSSPTETRSQWCISFIFSTLAGLPARPRDVLTSLTAGWRCTCGEASLMLCSSHIW